MNEINPARLPRGSVVANAEYAWIKDAIDSEAWFAWRCTNGGHYSAVQIQVFVDGGATVLRVGTS